MVFGIIGIIPVVTGLCRLWRFGSGVSLKLVLQARIVEVVALGERLFPKSIGLPDTFGLEPEESEQIGQTMLADGFTPGPFLPKGGQPSRPSLRPP